MTEHSTEDFSQVIDKKLDRSGWFYLMAVLLLLFIIISTVFPFLRRASYRNASFEQRISQLEQRVEQLENANQSSQ